MEPTTEKEGNKLKVTTPLEPTVERLSISEMKGHIQFGKDYATKYQILLDDAIRKGITEE